MSVKTYPQAPYYDDYDPRKGYVQVLAAAGNIVQSRELSQIGTMARDQIENLGTAMFYDGEIISGMSVVVKGAEVVVAPGSIFLNGMVRNVTESLVAPFEGVGKESVIIYVEESLVTAADDATLRNPALGTTGYLTAGASRVKQEVKIKVIDTDDYIGDGVKLVDLSNGVISYNASSTNKSTISKKDAELYGNHKISGLKVRCGGVDTTSATDRMHIMTLSPGKAIIGGSVVEVPNTVRFTIGTDHSYFFERLDSSLNVSYSASTDKYCEADKHIESASDITGVMFAGALAGVEVEKGSATETDLKSLVGRCDWIGNLTCSGTTYEQGTDYDVVRTGSSQYITGITWISGGSAPAAGAHYTFNARTIIDTTTTPSGYPPLSASTYLDLDTSPYSPVHFIKWKSSSPVYPVPNTLFYIYYRYIASRYIAILLNKNGEVSYVYGPPFQEGSDLFPIFDKNEYLPIGYIKFSAPDSFKTINIGAGNEYKSIQESAEDAEVFKNAVVNKNLDRAMCGVSAFDVSGALTDNFSELSSIWNNRSGATDISRRIYRSRHSIISTVLKNTGSSSSVQTGSDTRIEGEKTSRSSALSQTFATSDMSINGVGVCSKAGYMNLFPTRVKKAQSLRVNGTAWAIANVSDWWSISKGNRFKDTEIEEYSYFETRIKLKNFEPFEYMKVTLCDSLTDSYGSSVYTKGSIELPARTSGSYADGVQVPSSTVTKNWGNIQYTVIPKGTISTASSTITFLDGSVAALGSLVLQADANGEVEGLILCGTVSFNLAEGEYTIHAIGTDTEASFTYNALLDDGAIGGPVYSSKIESSVANSMCQTFFLQEDKYVDTLNLYFSSKDISYTLDGVVVQIRDTDYEGNPGDTVLGETYLPNSSINFNEASPVSTSVVFDTMYLHSNTTYCVCLKTTNPLYKLWTARTGETRIGAESTIKTNIFPSGRLFTSDSKGNWGEVKDTALKFDLLSVVYAGTWSTEFPVTLTSSDRTRVAFLADYSNNGALNDLCWEVYDNRSSSYIPITLGTFIDIVSLEITKLRVGRDYATDTKNSPFIAADSVLMVREDLLTPSTYYCYSSKPIAPGKFNRIKVSFEYRMMAGIVPSPGYYLGGSSFSISTGIRTKSLSDGWKRCEGIAINDTTSYYAGATIDIENIYGYDIEIRNVNAVFYTEE